MSRPLWLQRASRLGPLDWGKLAVKLITATRFGMDTFLVAVGGVGSTAPPVVVLMAVLDVLLIDVFFTLMWSVAAYAGTSRAAMSIRPFATLAAWVMYAVILVIGGATRDVVSLAVRVTGGLALAYDTFGYVRDWWQRRRDGQDAETLEEANARRRHRLWKRAYGFALRTYGAVAARASAFTMVHADLGGDLRRLRHRAAAHHHAADVEEGVVLAPDHPALPAQALRQDPVTGAHTWTCPYCHQEAGRDYDTAGLATMALKLHLRRDLPEHRHVEVYRETGT